jgi:glycosidase
VWWKGGTCYEIFVRSFQDSDGDGIGDLRGLIGRLDYVNDGDPLDLSDLGANCIWLMPITASPSYHGYDVIDYYRVDPLLGTNEDFRRLVREAHRKGIRVLVDMVINHASSEHPWFQEALNDPDSRFREWFRWSPVPGPPNEWGDSNWHASPVRDEYYYGFFWRTMPDLNWESPSLRTEMKEVATFWLTEMGADGLRLDAVRHLMEENGRTTNVPRTHDMLREYATHVRDAAPGAFTVGEVFDSTDVLLAYYPDQLDAYFAFQVANAIVDATRRGDAGRLLQAVTELDEEVPDHRWAPFLRNHDQTRAMTELGGDVARAKLAASLLLTLPGLPFVYYGEEIGMTGDKPDPRIRTPMHWSRDPAAGFTDGTPWEPLQPDSFVANVEVMEGDSTSLLNHYRRLVHLRSASPALGNGDFIPLRAESPKVVAYLRRSETETMLTVANLGETTLEDVGLSSEQSVLPPGRYTLLDAADGVERGTLAIASGGYLRGAIPLGVLDPLRAYVVRLESSVR